MQTFSHIATLTHLPSSLVLLGFRRPNFAEAQLNIDRELKRWSMK
jgi:hypothetical protein